MHLVIWCTDCMKQIDPNFLTTLENNAITNHPHWPHLHVHTKVTHHNTHETTWSAYHVGPPYYYPTTTPTTTPTTKDSEHGQPKATSSGDQQACGCF